LGASKPILLKLDIRGDESALGLFYICSTVLSGNTWSMILCPLFLPEQNNRLVILLLSDPSVSQNLFCVTTEADFVILSWIETYEPYFLAPQESTVQRFSFKGSHLKISSTTFH